MTMLRRIALASLAAPLALGLAACGSESTDAPAASAEPAAEVAAPAGTEWRDTVTVTDEGGYLVGNPEAPIELVEYGSLTCPACAAFAQQGSEELLGDYVNSGRVNFEFRSTLIHGAPDLILTRLISCGAPEAAVPLADQVWANLNAVLDPMQANAPALEQAMGLPENQRFVGFAEAAGFLDFFAARGLSKDQARTCLADFGAMEQLAERLDSQAREDEITRTPTFFLNGRMLEESSWAEVEALLQRAGAR
ncbi:DsbA family protein [Pelagerythrobacter sp.]|uniref:DsbA family protein n=1 Tax=Pelagerythrobacter sp. TaxID=2800702 RepID=UPI0035ADA612